jgi:hypothetical protein
MVTEVMLATMRPAPAICAAVGVLPLPRNM